MQNEKAYFFHRSFIFLFTQLLTLQICFGVFYLISSLVETLYEIRQTILVLDFVSEGMTIFLLLIAHFVLSVYLILRWINETYELDDNVIIHKQGVFSKKEEKFSLDLIDFVELKQGVFAKLFRTGTIQIKTSVHKHPIVLSMISNPGFYFKILNQRQKRVFIKEN